jgi:glycosyltransferase involved in cell wall biosynthesis
MRNSGPLVTIAMPVYDCERTLKAAVRSIQLQTHENWELLIIDDGSRDRTLEVARTFSDPRLKIITDGRHAGLPARLNEAIDKCRGKYLARMDGDDVAYPQRLEKQVRFLDSDNEVDLVGCWEMVFGREGVPFGKRTGMVNQQEMPTGFMSSIPIAHPTFLGKPSWFRKFGYAEWPLHFQDQHLLMRSIRSSRFAVLPEILLGYREERLSLEKQARYRMSYIRSFPQITKEFGAFKSCSLTFLQLMKLGLDIFAIVTGLKYRLLRNRAKRITITEREEWEEVWRSVNTVTMVGS